MANILVLDNYDSFTYNLVRYVKETGEHNVTVVRNDVVDMDEVEQFDGIILSPGPGIPEEAGLLLPLVERYYATKRIFGVCLGLQAITIVFGGKLINMNKVFHGVATEASIVQPPHYLFADMPGKILVGRYHSWMADQESFPPDLRVDATNHEEQIMALSHRKYDVCGVQFHPESILTPDGRQMVRNWLKAFASPRAAQNSAFNI